jgi:hypothetical protein
LKKCADRTCTSWRGATADDAGLRAPRRMGHDRKRVGLKSFRPSYYGQIPRRILWQFDICDRIAPAGSKAT